MTSVRNTDTQLLATREGEKGNEMVIVQEGSEYKFQVNLSLKREFIGSSVISDIAIYVTTSDGDDARTLAWQDLAEEIGYDDARMYEVVSVEVLS